MALTSLFTAVSGMNANSLALSVIGDNIANMNTTGFKSSRTAFGDILASQLGESQVGRGVLMTAITPQFNQGTFENTANVLDLAVDGDGLFILTDSAGSYYSRAGQFSMDSNGNVVNPSNQRLQGYLYSATGATTSGLGDINISALNSAPNSTSGVTISANLDSRSTIPPAFAVGSANATSNFSSSITVYDSLGNGHIVDVYFRKASEAAAGNSWEWFAVVGASDSLSGLTEIQANGTVTFTNNGALNTESAENYPLASGGFDFTGGAAQGQVIDFDFGNSIVTDSGTGLNGTTQFGSPSSTIYQNQDGFSSGSLKSITISQDGTMTGIFTNGQTRAIAQVALAKFAAPSNLQKMGKNLYAESTRSGQPVISTPGTSGTGTVLSNTLEQSNVDLAEEFVRLILSQRGFQANSRMISTSDELMMELVNLKR
jgi:flagellar hook protein FlgE